MTLLSCGCEQDGSARCRTHKKWGCHFDLGPLEEGAKWRSVSLSSAATPTRGKA